MGRAAQRRCAARRGGWRSTAGTLACCHESLHQESSLCCRTLSRYQCLNKIVAQDIILSRVVGFLTPNDAEAAMLVSTHFRSSAMSDFHWRTWALNCWADRQLDTFLPKIKEAKETDYRCGWRKLYWDSLEDSKRETLTEDELTRTMLM